MVTDIHRPGAEATKRRQDGVTLEICDRWECGGRIADEFSRFDVKQQRSFSQSDKRPLLKNQGQTITHRPSVARWTARIVLAKPGKLDLLPTRLREL